MATEPVEQSHLDKRLEDFLHIMPAGRRRAAVLLGVSMRTIDRYVKELRARGKEPEDYGMPIEEDRWGRKGSRR